VLIAVGGHSRNVGKTAVVTGVIRALPEFQWTAIKITRHRHGSGNYLLSEDNGRLSEGDSSRYLAAGAARAFLLRTASGGLRRALPALHEILAASAHVILESNSVLAFIQPDLYLVVLDFSKPDFKGSAQRYLDRASAFVLVDRDCARPPWAKLVPFQKAPVFEVAPPTFTCPALVEFLRARLCSEQQP
jgi:hypothetical protein